MANMDYPGPCFNCEAHDTCTAQEEDARRTDEDRREP